MPKFSLSIHMCGYKLKSHPKATEKNIHHSRYPHQELAKKKLSKRYRIDERNEREALNQPTIISNNNTDIEQTTKVSLQYNVNKQAKAKKNQAQHRCIEQASEREREAGKENQIHTASSNYSPK